MRVTLMSRASALAVLQTELVAAELRRVHAAIDVLRVTRSSEGDRDRAIDLAAAADKGLFTADLSQALVDGHADAVVHSWKDLPIEGHAGTSIAATLMRADPRDVLLVRREVVDRRPTELRVLSSAPRRVWQIETSGPRWLPWPVQAVRGVPVRGNIPTRLRKLIAGEGDALVVAKAALDRLLDDDAPRDVRAAIRAALDQCRWMVLPLEDHPAAPAQGALAIEIASARGDLAGLFSAIDHAPTRRAVEAERAMLASFGGGCHEAIGATVLDRPYGVVLSVRGRRPGTEDRIVWSLEASTPRPPHAGADAIWPRPDERDRAMRRPLGVSMPRDDRAWWVARADALPADWRPSSNRIIWTAGTRSWEKLAKRGVWVNGCADGLGEHEAPAVDRLAGRVLTWLRLTHDGVPGLDTLATYTVDAPLPAALDVRTHFYWTSGTVFRQALMRYPAIAGGWHASGPGRTADAIRETLGDGARASIWLDYHQWHRHVTS